MADKKYTLVESAAVFGLGGIFGVLIVLSVIPLDLALGWMRTQVWNWFFVPYLHLPQMNVWLMFAIMLFVQMFKPSVRPLKDESYKYSSLKAFLYALIVEGILFLILCGVHVWILK